MNGCCRSFILTSRLSSTNQRCQNRYARRLLALLCQDPRRTAVAVRLKTGRWLLYPQTSRLPCLPTDARPSYQVWLGLCVDQGWPVRWWSVAGRQQLHQKAQHHGQIQVAKGTNLLQQLRSVWPHSMVVSWVPRLHWPRRPDRRYLLP